MKKNRIDVHTHLIPPFWAEELKTHGGDPSGWGSPEWSPEAVLRFMDEGDIAVSMLSLTAPGVGGWKGADRVGIVRRVNDYGADLMRENPKPSELRVHGSHSVRHRLPLRLGKGLQDFPRKP